MRNSAFGCDVVLINYLSIYLPTIFEPEIKKHSPVFIVQFVKLLFGCCFCLLLVLSSSLWQIVSNFHYFIWSFQLNLCFFLFLRASGTADLSNRNNCEVETKSFHTKKTKEDYNLFNENLVKFFENRLV